MVCKPQSREVIRLNGFKVMGCTTYSTYCLCMIRHAAPLQNGHENQLNTTIKKMPLELPKTSRGIINGVDCCLEKEHIRLNTRRQHVWG